MIQLITLLGKKSIAYKWSLPCISSWQRIHGRSDAVHVISDGTLPAEFRHLLSSIETTGSPVAQEGYVAERLADYPCLRAMRDRDFSWRKILDVTIFTPFDADQCIYLDTDVLIRNPVEFRTEFLTGLTYMREDIPAYIGSWIAPIREPMVLSFNSGIVAFCPDLIDLEYLEYLAKKYFLHLNECWWSEQLAWSLLAGRMAKRFFWNGDQARVVSGCGTRTSEEMDRNIVKYFSRRNYMKSEDDLLLYSGRASIIHMAGMSKLYFEGILSSVNMESFQIVNSTYDPVLTLRQSLLVSARLAAKSAHSWWRCLT